MNRIALRKKNLKIDIPLLLALAATLGAWGIIDFAGRFSGAYIPPKYEDCIKPENVSAETEHITCTIRESYYDGTILRVTADVIPKEKVLSTAGIALKIL